MLPVKCERVDENGNRVFDVVWDHIHSMSFAHAVTTFDQRDENITKQKQAATRDLKSCLENNPNVRGREAQFQFDFMTEEVEPTVVEKVSENDIRKHQLPR